jgi:hypothetical protein
VDSSFVGKEAVVKNITLSADEEIIEAARQRARANRTTLNEEFRRWLAEYARSRLRASDAMSVIEEVRQRVKTGGRKFTRDEMNER